MVTMKELYKDHNPWLTRTLIINAICAFFIIYHNETFEQAIARIVFCNIFNAIILFGIDNLVHYWKTKS